MKSYNTDIAVNWFMALPFDERIAIANKYYPQYAEDNTDLEDAEIEHIYFSEYPILPDYKTWWKGLNEEEKYKLCCKHFQGIPVESLMERSIKVMYHYENPLTTETTTNTVTGEGFTKGEWLAGEIDTYGEFDIVARPIPEDGGDIICCAPQGWEDSMKRWTANKKRIVNCVNNFDSLVSALRDTLEVIKNNCDWTKFNRQEEESTEAAKQVLNQINQL